MSESCSGQMANSIEEVLAFWFDEGRDEAWFVRDEGFDIEVRALLAPLYDRAAVGDLDMWMESGRGCVALVILLDQVPRNLYRIPIR